jgi:hypothetical protein
MKFAMETHHFNYFKTILFALCMCFLVGLKQGIAQKITRCGSDEYTKIRLSKDSSMKKNLIQGYAKMQYALDHPESNKMESVITIPVVFHVLYNTSVQNISEAMINSQMNILNVDYSRMNADTSKTPNVWRNISSSTDFRFVLATKDPNGNPTNGIVRKATSNASFQFGADDERFASTGGDDAWDRDQYLNIWVVPTITSTGKDEVLGYCSPLGSDKSVDGVTVGYKFVGRNNNSAYFNLGRTVTHEVGHWLGLIHVWGTNNNSCGSSDSVADTPLVDACTPSNPGVMFMNFMDYSDDVSMNMFTKGQVARMNASVNAYRSQIKTSKGAILGIDEASVLNQIQIFPNPSSGHVKIQGALNSIRVSVYSLLGTLVYQNTLSEPQKNIDLSSEPDGCYIIKIEADNRFYTQRLMLLKP